MCASDLRAYGWWIFLMACECIGRRRARVSVRRIFLLWSCAGLTRNISTHKILFASRNFSSRIFIVARFSRIFLNSNPNKVNPPNLHTASAKTSCKIHQHCRALVYCGANQSASDTNSGHRTEKVHFIFQITFSKQQKNTFYTIAVESLELDASHVLLTQIRSPFRIVS